MTVYDVKSDVEQELLHAGPVLSRANAFFLTGLARIVDITRLSEGDDEEDYFVEVPANQLHDVSLRVADLEIAVQERFGVGISVLPIPVPA